VPGVSDNIRVTSTVGLFLEHSRIYYFHNGGNAQIYCGSADLMRRNLERRVEILFPIEEAPLKSMIREQILDIYLKDTKDATELQEDGSYVRVTPAEGEVRFSAQEWFLAQRSTPSPLSTKTAPPDPRGAAV